MNKAQIRNFAIIAHIDHGKSTLSDRFLELTGTIDALKIAKHNQYLDQNPISRERGITIKLAPVRMDYKFEETNYILNLIDTPGHVDFSYEVSRTLAACEGAVLLVDATQGIQAQTIAHLREAQNQKLTILPVINKIDSPLAEIEKTAKQIENLGFNTNDITYISARTGENTKSLLQKIIKKIPYPAGVEKNPFRALIFDAIYDEHQGVVAFIKVVDGEVKKNDELKFMQTNTKSGVIDVGIFKPNLVSKEKLSTGEIGFLITGVKDIRLVRVGETISANKENIEILSGYNPAKPLVFFGVYPKTTDDLINLRLAIEKMSLTDASISFSEEYSAFLGSGFRVGFLGLLHAEIFKERIDREFGQEPLFTIPRVNYEQKNDVFLEPFIQLSVFTPKEYVGAIMTICQKARGQFINISYEEDNAIVIYDMPLSKFLKGISPEIKSATAGFASLDYNLSDYRNADIVTIDILINGETIDVLTEYSYRDEADFVAREKAKKLKGLLPRQQFKQIIQCSAGGKILAREEIPSYRKDVLAKMSGGDRTRKDKLLEAQKKGKKKMQNTSRLEIPQNVLFSMIKN